MDPKKKKSNNKKTVKKKPVKKEPDVKKETDVKKKSNKKKGIIVEKDSVHESEIDENKYSEKLKKLLTNIKNRSHTDSEVKIRFAWKK